MPLHPKKLKNSPEKSGENTLVNFQHFHKFLAEVILPALHVSGAGAKVGVACSGGGDSMALALLLLENVPSQQLVILNFDHHLRAGSAAESAFVCEFFQEKGVQVVSGKWGDSKKSQGNMQQAARRARYAFFATQQEHLNLVAVATAHTADDVAENFLMRAGKGSGLKGLAAMPTESLFGNMKVWRPVLQESGANLRAYLCEKKVTWVEDASNTNSKFKRVRVRQLRHELESAGISFQALAAAAFSLSRALNVVTQQTEFWWQEHVVILSDSAIFFPECFLNLPEEISLSLMEKVILTLNPAPLAPRTSKRQRLLATLREKCAGELGGVRVQWQPEPTQPIQKSGFLFSKISPDNS